VSWAVLGCADLVDILIGAIGLSIGGAFILYATNAGAFQFLPISSAHAHAFAHCYAARVSS
jgi:hypothetical protein